MGRRKLPYPPEFREEAVRLVQEGGKSIGQIAKDLGIADQSFRNWVKQADLDAGRRTDGLTTEERAELRRLRELLDPLQGLCRGASPVGSRLAAAVSYRAAWSLPGPDFHRLVSVSLHEVAVSSISTSFHRCLAGWARRNRVNFNPLQR